jgi:hypothetical protein
MTGTLRPLILLAEAPKGDADPAPPDDATPPDAEADPAPKGGPAPADPPDDPPADVPPPTDDADPVGDDEEGDPGAADGGPAPAETPDAVADRLRREQLLEEIDRATAQAASLSRSLAFLADRANDPQARAMAVESKKIVDEAERQCSIILVNFSDLGYDRVQTAFRTVRERVAAVAEIVKHVIDGDDDFRDSDSDSGTTERGTTRRPGKA